MYRFEVPFKIYLALLTFLIVAQCAKAQTPTNEAKMKSELILKLIDKVDWSENNKTIRVGIAGDDLNFAKNLMFAASSTSKSIVLENDLSKCDIIYVPINNLNFSLDKFSPESLVISAYKTNASMYFDYEDGKLLLKTANPKEAQKKGLAAEVIAP